MMAKMSDEELKALCQTELRQGIGFTGGELSDQRRRAMDEYYGNKYGNEVDGRSEYVSRDIADTVEWIMPSLMRIFASGDQIVRFEPVGPEDVTMWATVSWQSVRSEAIGDSAFYAQGLLEEIRSKRFDEKTGNPWTSS